MKLTVVQGLLVATVTICHRDRCTVVENMVVDTGSAHTWVNVNAVDGELDLTPVGADEIVTAFGLGGRDVAVRKTIDEITFDSFHARAFSIEVGSLGPGLGGLIGLDLLRAGQFLLDFDALDLRRANHS